MVKDGDTKVSFSLTRMGLYSLTKPECCNRCQNLDLKGNVKILSGGANPSVATMFKRIIVFDILFCICNHVFKQYGRNK